MADKTLDTGRKALLTDKIFILSLALMSRTLEPIHTLDVIVYSLALEDSTVCPNTMLRLTALGRILKINNKYFIDKPSVVHDLSTTQSP